MIPVALAQADADEGPESISIVSPSGEMMSAASPWPTLIWWICSRPLAWPAANAGKREEHARQTTHSASLRRRLDPNQSRRRVKIRLATRVSHSRDPLIVIQGAVTTIREALILPVH